MKLISLGPLSRYYSVQIFNQIGIKCDDALRYQAINTVIALLGEFCCMMFIDRFGRQWPLIIGNLGNMVTFIVCNFSNALFFWLFLPETSKLPLEGMNYLLSNSPWVVVGVKRDDYVAHDLERKLAEEAKSAKEWPSTTNKTEDRASKELIV
jgi:hypothetical protein